MAQDAVGPSDKAALLRDLDATFAQMMVLAERLGDFRPVARPEQGWGPFEVMSHIASWHELSADRLRRMARGEDAAFRGDPDELNARFAAERRRLSSEKLLALVRQSFESMRAAAGALPESAFVRDRQGQEHSLAYFVLLVNGPDHYREHLQELEEAK